jgi:hypothetical protein
MGEHVAIPPRVAGLPFDPQRGVPVPWFVTWFDESGNPCRNGEGKPDFRVITGARLKRAYLHSLCWICGGPMGTFKTFVIGPMCAVNRISSEPPSHLDCAEYAACACPFLAKPHMRRREHNLPEGHVAPPGNMIARNPGVALLWTTKRFRIIPAEGAHGFLFEIGDPEHVRWFAEGRKATRAEVLESIDSGLPALRSLARGAADLGVLDQMHEVALRYVPAAEAT